MQSQPNPPDVRLFQHGGNQHETVTVDAYNSELRDADGYLGDRASKRAFLTILEKHREQTRQVAEDPLGDSPTDGIRKKTLEKVLLGDDLEAAGLVHAAIEEFAQELSAVASRFLKLKAWRETQRIVVGGGFSDGKPGELAIHRASVLLQTRYEHKVELVAIRHHPDEAGLLGNIHVVPPWMFRGYDSLLAIDIGGSNIRVGLVELRQDEDKDFKAACVASSELWRHCDDSPTREDCVERMADLLRTQIKQAEKLKLKLAPLIGVACPGLINADGSIEKGGQNLPGNWESSRFNLSRSLKTLIPEIAGNETIVVMHNDAVVQGLSEAPWMTDIRHWAVLTIGTGLGNAHFTNRPRVGNSGHGSGKSRDGSARSGNGSARDAIKS